jgi:hypothetical protein
VKQTRELSEPSRIMFVTFQQSIASCYLPRVNTVVPSYTAFYLTIFVFVYFDVLVVSG